MFTAMVKDLRMQVLSHWREHLGKYRLKDSLDFQRPFQSEGTRRLGGQNNLSLIPFGAFLCNRECPLTS
jgi:hypothetical protein